MIWFILYLACSYAFTTYGIYRLNTMEANEGIYHNTKDDDIMVGIFLIGAPVTWFFVICALLYEIRVIDRVLSVPRLIGAIINRRTG